MKKITLLFFAMSFIANLALSQAPLVQWQTVSGITNSSTYTNDDVASSIKQVTSDGGYVVLGTTDDQTNGRYRDFRLVKFNSSGVQQWERSYGGSGDEVGNAVIETQEGGFIMVGHTTSDDGDAHASGYHYDPSYPLNRLGDIWVIKVSSTGTKQWQKAYGGTYGEEGTSILQTDDGLGVNNGYIITGSTNSIDGDLTGVNTSVITTKTWVLKITNSGTISWKSIYGTDGSFGKAIRAVTTSISTPGYVVTSSGNVSGVNGALTFRLSSSGTLIWQNFIVGVEPSDVIQLKNGSSDDGFVIAGNASDNLSGVAIPGTGAYHGSGGNNGLLVKISDAGVYLSHRFFGGTSSDEFTSLTNTADGKAVVSGLASSTDYDLLGINTTSDIKAWVLKFSATGSAQPSLVWQQVYAGPNVYGNSFSIIQTSDNGFAFTGNTQNASPNPAPYPNGTPGTPDPDFWVVKLGEVTIVCPPCEAGQIGDILYNTCVCEGSSITLSCATSGGVWSSSDPTIATVDASTGIVTGVIGGFVNITYTIGGLSASVAVRVFSLPTFNSPAITGDNTICSSGSTLLTADANDASTYQWYLNGVAISGATNQTYSATTSGSYTVKITNTPGCFVTSDAFVVTVVTVPPVEITGLPEIMCSNSFGGGFASAILLGSASSGGIGTPAPAGTWSSSLTSVATIGLTSGLVSPVAPGSTTITYTYSVSGCDGTASLNLDVVASPVITANTTSLTCAGTGVTLTITPANRGNQWYIGSTAISGAVGLTYNPTTVGNYSVVSTITGCVSNSINITVGPPAITPISGASTICTGNTVTLTDATAGGVWSSSNTAIATVNSGGVVTPVAAGSVTISYTVTNSSCSAVTTKNITINASPVIGTNSTLLVNMCTLNSNVNIYNSNTSGGGVWTSSNTAVATVTTISGATGAVTSVANGTAILTYIKTAANGCQSTASTTVNVAVVPTPNSITGLTSVCVGGSITLSCSTTGGSWNTGYTTQASINSLTGVLKALNPGNIIANYTVSNSYGCSASSHITITINANPGVPGIGYAPGTVNPQTGPGGAFCTNRTFTVVGSPTGGTWSNGGVLTVGSSSGIVNTGSVPGSGSLTYTYTNANGCSNSKSLTGTVANCPGGRSVSSLATTDENIDINKITLYPNPAKSFVNFLMDKLVGEGKIVVTDLYGKQVKTQPLSMGSNRIDITNFSKGVYMVSIITSEGKITRKLVVE